MDFRAQVGGILEFAVLLFEVLLGLTVLITGLLWWRLGLRAAIIFLLLVAALFAIWLFAGEYLV